MHLEYQVYEADFVNAGAASSAIKKTLKQLNISPQIVKRVVVALYEAEVNAIAHAFSSSKERGAFPLISKDCKSLGYSVPSQLM